MMAILLKALKICLLWIILPLALSVIFVVAPCYTLGEFLHQEAIWCGFKGAPPHMGTQFVAGIVTGLALAFYVSWRSHRHRAKSI